MWIDPTTKILNLDGEQIKDGDKPLTFGYVATTMLLAQFHGEENMPGPKKLDRFALAEKFHGAMMPVDIDNSQAELLLQLCEKGLPILTYGRMSRIIKAAQAAPITSRPNGHAEHANAP